MAKLLQPFNAANFDPTQSGPGGLPIGKHPVRIIADEIVPVKEKDGGLLLLTLEIIDGEYRGSTGAFRLNLYNKSQQAVEIAQRQFSAVCHVTGVMNVDDASVLHNIPFMVEVGLQKEPNPNKYTEIRKVFDIHGNEPGKAPQNGGGQQQPQNNGQQQQPQNNAGWGNNGQASAPANVQMPQNNGGQQQPQGGGQQWGNQPQGGQQQPQNPQGGQQWGNGQQQPQNNQPQGQPQGSGQWGNTGGQPANNGQSWGNNQGGNNGQQWGSQ